MSLASWTDSLESELQGNSDHGWELRLDVFLKSVATEREAVIRQISGQEGSGSGTALSSSVVMEDSDSTLR